MKKSSVFQNGFSPNHHSGAGYQFAPATLLPTFSGKNFRAQSPRATAKADLGTIAVWLTVAQCAAKYPAFTENALRALIQASKPRKRSISKNGLGDIAGNGLADSIIKLGRRILFDEHAFSEWVNSHAATRLSKGPHKLGSNGLSDQEGV